MSILRNFDDERVKIGGFHIVFFIVAIVILLLPINLPIGVRILIIVLLYNITLFVYTKMIDDEVYKKIFIFSFFISLFQLFPDWYLAEQLGVLVFPEDGFIKIGDSVSLYMVFLWSIPIFIIITIAYLIEQQKNELTAYLASGIAAFIIFVSSEMTLWVLPSWYAVNVVMIAKVAVYIIIPEIILGIVSYWGFKYTLDKKIKEKLVVSFFVMIIYLGLAAFFYFIFEGVLFPFIL